MPLTASSTCYSCERRFVEDSDEEYRSVFECPTCRDVFVHERCSSYCLACGNAELRDVSGRVVALRESTTREEKEKKGKESAKRGTPPAPAPTTTGAGAGALSVTAAERERLEAEAHAKLLPADDDDDDDGPAFDLGTVNSVDTSNEFGAFDRSFRWVPPAGATGYIVQRIDRTERVNRDDGSIDDTRSSVARYWEAWPVVDGTVRGADGTTVLDTGAHDSWVARDLPACRGRHGRWEVIGTVYWLPQGTPLPAVFRRGAVPAASPFLLSTFEDPHLVGESLMVHSRSGSWDARTLTAACELLARWQADDVLTDGVTETLKTLTDDYRFSRAIAAAAVEWGQGRGYTFQP
ncbi:hypothetical protein [Embleya sp. NPDC020630]|uniref:hypothetical protein n=1 Tax=Embleya sp. NPDC020630 TaxID=3363979 RepID=UPI0037A9D981